MRSTDKEIPFETIVNKFRSESLTKITESFNLNITFYLNE